VPEEPEGAMSREELMEGFLDFIDQDEALGVVEVVSREQELEHELATTRVTMRQVLAILEVESKKFNPDLLMIREATYILRSALK
jgi:hypothetical protein